MASARWRRKKILWVLTSCCLTRLESQLNKYFVYPNKEWNGVQNGWDGSTHSQQLRALL